MKCDECGTETANYYEVGEHNLCLGCYADIKDKVISSKKTSKLNKRELKEEILNELKEIKISQKRTPITNIGLYLKILGVISGIICILAGINMLTISAEINTIMLAYYNSMGVFALGFGIFVIGLLWGIAYLIEKK